MANRTTDLPYLPSYSLMPVPPLLPWISDFHLSLLLPVAAYWIMSLIFWFIDNKDLFSQYRLHTPEEFKQRNLVSAIEVLRSVLVQQAIQTGLGLLIGYLSDAGDFYGREAYDITVWAGRIHQAREVVPWILAPIGIDARTLGQKFQTYALSLSTNVAANKPTAFMNLIISSPFGQDLASGFAIWEIWAAKTIYWVLEPAARFGIAIFFSDSWQYFWHRAMHANKWIYRKPPCLHPLHLPVQVPLPRIEIHYRH